MYWNKNKFDKTKNELYICIIKTTQNEKENKTHSVGW